ncbi:MAG: hypothetical protein K6E21_04180 [Bacilli bacterium]|nr:hypothetical protein [Bacilli bacterium]
MFKKLSTILFIGLLASCSGAAVETPTEETKEEKINKLSINIENVKTLFYKGDSFSLDGIEVSLMEFKNFEWVKEKDISNYVSSIKEGDTLNNEGEVTVTVSYQDYVPFEYTIDVIDIDKYKTNKDFDFAKNTYLDSEGNTKPINTTILANNCVDIAYLDPLSKNNHVLVVPYYFSEDEDMATEENREIIKTVFFGSEEDMKKHNQPYSVKSYYEASSFGKTIFDGDVLPWIKASVGSSENMVNGGYAASEDIYNRYVSEYNKENHGILGKDAKEWTYYDGNKDGCIDLIWFVYSKDMQHVGTDQWWAYTAHDATKMSPSINRPVPKTICWGSFGFLFGNYDPHTFVHETGHAYGLVDYYCYNGSWSPMGGIAMMDNNFGDHDSYSKFSLGWSVPRVVDESAIITLKPFATSNESVLLPSPNFNNTFLDEYLLLEYDGPFGLSTSDYINGYSGLMGYNKPGLRILHVDSRGIKDSNHKAPLVDNYLESSNFAYDNSKFGRNSGNKPSGCQTDYFEAINNPTNLDRSYALLTTIPATYNVDRNNFLDNIKLDNSALFTKGTTFSFNDGWTEFLPSACNLWNKARVPFKNSKGEYLESTIDKNMTIDYSIKVLEMSNEEIVIKIDKEDKNR